MSDLTAMRSKLKELMTVSEEKSEMVVVLTETDGGYGEVFGRFPSAKAAREGIATAGKEGASYTVAHLVESGIAVKTTSMRSLATGQIHWRRGAGKGKAKADAGAE